MFLNFKKRIEYLVRKGNTRFKRDKAMFIYPEMRQMEDLSNSFISERYYGARLSSSLVNLHKFTGKI